MVMRRQHPVLELYLGDTIGTELRDPINSGLTRWRVMAVCNIINRTPPQESGGFSLSMEMINLTRAGTAEPVSRDQILRRERGQGKIHFP